MGRKSNINWAKGRSLYTQQGNTMAQVAVALSVTTRAVQRHAASEGWKDARAHSLAKTVAIADTMGAEQAAEQIVEIRQSLTDALPLLRTAVMASLGLINAKLEADTKDVTKVSLKNVVALLSAVAGILESLTTAQTPASINTTSILVQLQALGASGRVAVYRQLTD